MTRCSLFLRQGTLTVALVASAGQGFASQPGSSAPASQSSKQDVTVIHTNVRRVLIDVVVTDSHDEPVRGLTKDDFSIQEDGKPQTIRTFDVHDFNAAPEFIPKLPQMEPNTFLNLPREPERGPLYVLLYDMVNMDAVDQPYARKQLLSFINNKPAGTRFAIIVLSDGMHMVQGFTEDKNELLAVLDDHSNRPHVPRIFLYGENYGNNNPSYSVSAFTELAHYLEGFPGRKNVLWFSGKFPLSLFANLGNDIIGDGDYTDKVKDIVDTLARDQIAIYPVDVQTVVVTEVYAPSGSAGPGGQYSDSRNATGGSSSNPASGSSNGSGGSAGQSSAGQASGGASGAGSSSHAAGGPGYSQTSAQYMAEDELARTTGGRAYYSTNDLTLALQKATANGANYYTLSYSPSNTTFNGKLRNIRVELAEKGYKLAYRRSYFGIDPGVRPQSTDPVTVELAGSHGSIPQDDPLSTAMRHGAPMAHDVIFRAQFHAVGTPALATPEQMAKLVDDPGSLRRNKPKRPAKTEKPIPLQSYTVDYRVLNAQTKPGSTEPSAETMEFSAVAFDAEGNMLSGVLQDAARDAGQSAAKKSTFYSVQQQIDVPLKAAWIRVAVRDLATNRVGTLEIPLPLAPNLEATAGAGPSSSPPPQAGKAH